MWHLVHYQRFYNSLVAQLVPTAEEANQSLVLRVGLSSRRSRATLPLSPAPKQLLNLRWQHPYHFYLLLGSFAHCLDNANACLYAWDWSSQS